MRDPWFFQRWAFGVQTGNPVRKSVLSMLAMMADATTGRCEAKQDRLAQGVEASERAVRGHLKALEEAGVIARRAQYRVDRGRRGDEYLLLAPGVTEWPDGEPVQPARYAGGSPGTDGPHPPAPGDTPPGVSDLPGKNDRQGTTSQNGHASKQEDAREDPRQLLPEDFPEQLVPHARHVFRVLRSVAEQHNAREVTPRAVGLTIAGNPGRRFVAEAHAMAAWAQAPPRPILDVVGTYRTWLKRAEVFAGVEHLEDDGRIATGPARPPAGVTPLHGRGSNADRVQANLDALDEMERRFAG